MSMLATANPTRRSKITAACFFYFSSALLLTFIVPVFKLVLGRLSSTRMISSLLGGRAEVAVRLSSQATHGEAKSHPYRLDSVSIRSVARPAADIMFLWNATLW